MFKIEDITYMVSLFCPGKCVNCNIWQYEKNEIKKDELLLSTFEKIFSSKYLKDTNYFDLTAGESQLSENYIETIKIIANINQMLLFIQILVDGILKSILK